MTKEPKFPLHKAHIDPFQQHPLLVLGQGKSGGTGTQLFVYTRFFRRRQHKLLSVFLYPPANSPLQKRISSAVAHLMVGFVLHILPVHLHHSVPGTQPAQVSRRTGLHFPDELSAFVALAVQVKAIPAIPFGQETESGSQLALHPPSASIDEGGKTGQKSLRRIHRCLLQAPGS